MSLSEILRITYSSHTSFSFIFYFITKDNSVIYKHFLASIRVFIKVVQLFEKRETKTDIMNAFK